MNCVPKMRRLVAWCRFRTTVPLPVNAYLRQWGERPLNPVVRFPPWRLPQCDCASSSSLPSQPPHFTLPIHQPTQMIYVGGYSGQAQDFVPDDNPNTIQIVPLASESQGTSHVSADGQVIFLRRSSDEAKMQDLIEEAFARLLAVRIAGT